MEWMKKAGHMAQEAADYIEDVVSSLTEANEAPSGNPQPVHKKAYLLIFNPRVPSAGGKKLTEVLGWHNPDDLVQEYIKDVREISYGYANYTIVKRDEADYLPHKTDGFRYEPDNFVKAWQSKGKEGGGFHTPDWADYTRILKDFNIIAQINAGEFDEVFMFGGPYGGFYESQMGGPGAFWCNAPAMENTEQANRRFVMMGFSYQRGVGEMLENLGHRAESIMRQVYRKHQGEDNLWEKFARYDQTHPGRAEVGIMHFAPNSTKDYEWGRTNAVPSVAHTWLNFPDLRGAPKLVTNADWGGGDVRLHHQWWFRHLPHTTGRTKGISHNWWEYIIDPNTVR